MPGAPNASGRARGEGRARQMRAGAHAAKARRSECERARTGRMPGAPHASGRARGKGRARQMRAGARGARARRTKYERARTGEANDARAGAEKSDSEWGAGMTAKTDSLEPFCGLFSCLAYPPHFLAAQHSRQAHRMRAGAHGANARRTECERARTGRGSRAPNASGRARGKGQALRMRARAHGANARRTECERESAGRRSRAPNASRRARGEGQALRMRAGARGVRVDLADSDRVPVRSAITACLRGTAVQATREQGAKKN